MSKFWKEYVEEHGKPVSVYLDKFSTYKVNHKNAVDNHELLTQFEGMTQRIGIKLITAHSPEAKGRIETFQNPTGSIGERNETASHQ